MTAVSNQSPLAHAVSDSSSSSPSQINNKGIKIATAIFALAAVGFAIATPFTATILIVPALACALIALGLYAMTPSEPHVETPKKPLSPEISRTSSETSKTAPKVDKNTDIHTFEASMRARDQDIKRERDLRNAAAEANHPSRSHRTVVKAFAAEKLALENKRNEDLRRAQLSSDVYAIQRINTKFRSDMENLRQREKIALDKANNEDCYRSISQSR